MIDKLKHPKGNIMIKFKDYKLTFQEVPDEISLCINITGCPNNCECCHSPDLREDIGKELTTNELDSLIKNNRFATCITFMGGDHKELELIQLLKYIKDKGLKTCLYSGSDNYNDKFLSYLDYYKYGSYKRDFGSLSNKTTNQKFLEIKDNKDITYRFWKNK